MRKTIKAVITSVVLLLLVGPLAAQSVSYKSGMLSVDGKEIAKIVKLKAGFAQPANYELYAMSGEKLIIAVLASDLPPDPQNNTDFYYRFSFLTTSQVGLFTLSILSAEKSFAKLIGQSGIIVDDKLNEAKINEFIALKSKNPIVRTEYNIVKRNMMFPVMIKDDNMIYQGMEPIGKFKNISSGPEGDTYEFSLPDGLIVAKVSFTGGNSASKFIINTKKDNQIMPYTIAPDGFGKTIISSASVDKNEHTILRIAKWLVNGKYM